MTTLHIRCAQDIPDVLVSADLPSKLALLQEIARRAETLTGYCARDGVDLVEVLLERLPHCRSGSSFHSYLVKALARFDTKTVTEAFKVELNQVLPEETERLILGRLARAPEADVAWTLRPYLMGDDATAEWLAPHLRDYTSLGPDERLRLALLDLDAAAPEVDHTNLAAWEREFAGPHGERAAAKLMTLGRDSFTFLSRDVSRLSLHLHSALLEWGAQNFTVESVPLLAKALDSDVPTTARAALKAIGRADSLKLLFAERVRRLCTHPDPELRRAASQLAFAQAALAR